MSASALPPIDDRRARVVYVAAWGHSTQQPGWALQLGVKINRAIVCGRDEAQDVAEAGAKQAGFPAYVQKWGMKPAAGDLPAARVQLGFWRLEYPTAAGGRWEDLL